MLKKFKENEVEWAGKAETRWGWWWWSWRDIVRCNSTPILLTERTLHETERYKQRERDRQGQTDRQTDRQAGGRRVMTFRAGRKTTALSRSPVNISLSVYLSIYLSICLSIHARHSTTEIASSSAMHDIPLQRLHQLPLCTILHYRGCINFRYACHSATEIWHQLLLYRDWLEQLLLLQRLHQFLLLTTACKHFLPPLPLTRKGVPTWSLCQQMAIYTIHILRYTTLYSTQHTLHYTTLHWTTIHYTKLRYAMICYALPYYARLHYTSLHYATRHCTTLHYTTLHYTTTLHYVTLHYTTLHYTSLLYTIHTPFTDSPRCIYTQSLFSFTEPRVFSLCHLINGTRFQQRRYQWKLKTDKISDCSPSQPLPGQSGGPKTECVYQVVEVFITTRQIRPKVG